MLYIRKVCLVSSVSPVQVALFPISSLFILIISVILLYVHSSASVDFLVYGSTYVVLFFLLLLFETLCIDFYTFILYSFSNGRKTLLGAGVSARR